LSQFVELEQVDSVVSQLITKQFNESTTTATKTKIAKVQSWQAAKNGAQLAHTNLLECAISSRIVHTETKQRVEQRGKPKANQSTSHNSISKRFQLAHIDRCSQR
jgi:hypothetical protein